MLNTRRRSAGRFSADEDTGEDTGHCARVPPAVPGGTLNYAVPGTEAMHAVIELKFDLARDHEFEIEGLVRFM